MEEAKKIKEQKEAERRFVESKHQLIVKTWHYSQNCQRELNNYTRIYIASIEFHWKYMRKGF